MDNREYGSWGKIPFPKITQEIVDKASGVFAKRKFRGSETLMEVGIDQGQQNVIEWLQKQVTAPTVISGNPDDVKR